MAEESENMKLKGEVNKLVNTGDAIRVSLSNIRTINEAEWRQPGHLIVFEVPQSNKAFRIGRSVVVTVEAR